jgi:signal transduction histidine kinase
MTNIIAFRNNSTNVDAPIPSGTERRCPLHISRQTIELTLLPLVLAVVVSLSVAYCIKCLVLPVVQLISPLQTVCYMAPISGLAFLVAARTGGFIRAAVLFQLAAVALIAVNGFSGAHEPLFVDVFSAIVCGGITGALNSLFRNQQRRLQSQSSEIELRRRQLRDAKLALVKHDEVERRLLAADLHDQVLHDLKMIKQTLSKCRAQLDPSALESLQADVGHCTGAVREVMEQLFPSSLEHLGLVGAIEECLDNAGRRCNFETFVRAKVDGDEFDSLTRVETLLLFRLIQEAVNNISKHAQAKNVSCQLSRDKEHLIVRIIDDGVGFKPGSGDGRGLKYMKQRAELIGAHIAWLPNTKDASGTIVEIRIALPAGDGQRTKVVS